MSFDIKNIGKNVEFPRIENIFSEFFKKLKVSDYKEKSENFYNSLTLSCKKAATYTECPQ